MSKLLFDIEGNGFVFGMDTVWCIVTKDIDTGEKEYFPPEDIAIGIDSLKGAEVLAGHNIIGYDLPALWKVYGEWDHVPLIIDTLVISRALNPERKGGHSLAAWGERLGYPKIEFNEYDRYSQEMLEYCEQDVEVNHKVLTALEEEHGSTFPGYKVYR